MKKELLKYIKELSLRDSKTLSQKALKVSEESGELARVVLPYDNAAGTIHRFIEDRRVLEESVDVILTAISMAYELGFSDEDIEEMMWDKARKWHGIQAKEGKMEYPVPYEIHVTVDLDAYYTKLWNKQMMNGGIPCYPKELQKEAHDKLKQEAIDDFKEACKEINVKPIVLDLENSGESVMKDVMTSSHHMGNNTSTFLECNRISSQLENCGFKVVRRKIETVPWHPAAPVNYGDKMPEDCYFEAHIGCLIKPELKPSLERIANLHNAHLSRNYFKKLEDGKFVNMITLRSTGGVFENFEARLDELKKDLDENKFQYEKVITEFSIYDTNVSHDYKWLEKKVEA